MRLLTGILAGQEFDTKLSGDGSLQKRPMKRVVGPLREMGADIRARDDNFAPLEIKAARLHAIDYQMPMASAQVKSAVLLAGLFAEGVTSVTEPARTRDHTELALEEFGAAIERHGRTTKIHGLFGGNGAGKLMAKSLDVPGDLSSAVFFIAAASLLPDSSIAIHNVGSESDAHGDSGCVRGNGSFDSDAFAEEFARGNRWRSGCERCFAKRRSD